MGNKARRKWQKATRVGTIVSCLWPLACHAVATGAEPLRDKIDVVVQTVEADLIHGRLAALSLIHGAAIQTEEKNARRVATTDLVRITMPQTVSRGGLGQGTTHPGDVTLLLTQGDRLHGRIVGGDTETILFETIALGEIRVPLDATQAVHFSRASGPAYRDSAAWFERDRAEDSDRVLLTNGDVISGFIKAIDATGVSIDGTLGEAKLPRRLVVAAQLVAAKPPPIDGAHFVLMLRQTGRLTVTAFELSHQTVEARLWYGESVTFQADRIARIDVAGGRWEWLSTHQPISYQHTPMLSLAWEYVPNRNVLGAPIRVAGETFDYGIGVHSRSSLTYDLKGIYREFVTSLGIDDSGGPYADVSVLILFDGKRRFDQSHVKRGKLLGPVRLDVTKAKRLELIVDYGDNGDIQDRFDWVEAALIR